MSFTAIETRYKGYRFRSRLEARWAVFFDDLGLRWEYEPEGFELPSGRYLPDFKVFYPGRWDDEAHYEWFECKGDLRTVTHDEWAKMIEFQKAKGLVVLDGIPACRMYLTPTGLCSASGEIKTDELLPRLLAAQPHAYSDERFGYALWCGRKRLWVDEHRNFFDTEDGSDEDQQAIAKAVQSARSARFEHGERGAR